MASEAGINLSEANFAGQNLRGHDARVRNSAATFVNAQKSN